MIVLVSSSRLIKRRAIIFSTAEKHKQKDVDYEYFSDPQIWAKDCRKRKKA